MNTLKSLGVGVVSFVLIVFVVVGGYNLLALNLGTVTGDYFKGAAAVFVLLGGAWLTSQGLGFMGKPFMIGASILLISITLKYRVPGFNDLATQTTKAADRTAQRLAVDLAAPRVIPCDRTTPDIRFFDGSKPLVWLSETPNGRLICYDRPGEHPQTQRTLVAVDTVLAERILRQEPPPVVHVAPQVAVVTPPAIAPEPTPPSRDVRVLSEQKPRILSERSAQ